MTREPAGRQLLIQAFVGLADTLVDDYDIIDLLDRLVGYSVELLAADAAGILLADPQGELRVVASSQRADRVDGAHAAAGRPGPLRGVLPHRRPGQHHRPGRRGTALAAVRRRPRRPGLLPLGACAAAAAARRGHWHDEPVPPASPGRCPPPTWPWGRRWPTWPRSGSCRTRHPPRRGAQRAAPDRAEQPHHHRAGQGRARPAREPRAWTPRSTGSAATHARTTCASARSPTRSSTPTSPQPCSPPPPPPVHPRRECGDLRPSQAGNRRPHPPVTRHCGWSPTRPQPTSPPTPSFWRTDLIRQRTC